MTNTYGNDPANNPIDAVRFWISDRAAPFQLSDEEIAYTLTLYPTPLLAAAALANELAMKWALFVDKAVGDLKLSYSQRAKMYAELAAKLQTQAEQNGVSLYSGGTSKSDMASVAANCDRVPQPFGRGQFDITPQADQPAVPPDGCED
jgi:hypothetical protein